MQPFCPPRKWIRFVLLLSLVLALARPAAAEPRRDVGFPDLPGYLTLAADLHMHTVFSDGQVWPSVRVDEAYREGLDVIAITDHIEYHPFKADIPVNLNRSYEIARGPADAQNIILIRGGEITRDTPPGHFNAIFLDDIDPLDQSDLLAVFQAAADQHAFVFWNHPGWPGPDEIAPGEVQLETLRRGQLHGVEICNGRDYYPLAHQWALDNNLTLVGNSDIHGPSLNADYQPDDHRTLTLVFATERTAEAVHQALRERRTLVWCNEQLIGRSDLLQAMFDQCVRSAGPFRRTDQACWFEVTNTAPIDIQLRKRRGHGPDHLTLPAGRTVIVRVNHQPDESLLEVDYQATNLLVAPDTGLNLYATIPLD